MSSAYVTAREVMDASAVLLNDPAKTDYTHEVLLPLLTMALHELSESLIDSQGTPTVITSMPIVCPVGTNAIYPSENPNPAVPHYPDGMVEIQEVRTRKLGSSDSFTLLTRVEYMPPADFPCGMYTQWSWEVQTIILHRAGTIIPQEIVLHFIGDLNVALQPYGVDSVVGGVKSRSFLTYKTAAYAAMFFGENSERAQVLETQAEKALERIDSINNKGRQQIMTRHRPFRAAWKARGGF
jgi:hypothetical protein